MVTDQKTTEVEDNKEWIDAGDYSFKLHNGVIVARNAKGRVLKTVPAKAKKLQQYEQLEGLRIFLAQHEEQCLEYVRKWFLHGLPVPLSVIIAVWPDPSWRKYLNDVIVSDGQITGFLRSTNEQGIQVIDLDGESTLIPFTDEATVLLQHPAILEELEEWREFAVELGVHQGLDQLFRDVYQKPSDSDGQKAAVNAYQDGKYDRYAHLLGRARGGGFVATMAMVTVDVFEHGETITAALDIDAWDPSEGATLGTLTFTKQQKTMKLEEVGPIAWSEGIRMSEFIYAGRTIETKGEGN
ncbi:DUF4132 domain-containing protein [Corynebacterium freiburgense]|uniref:DUF4132 domain-containing protein n=1 Tax=Corynebacterium freiburgense TaxID=556548 RepID=UPI000404E06B|nr:DUF4132 domain-containing protein [Corynebacterium freiburgense]WJZ02425.1 hypothetical protein CFREI_05650 [Corynebacterium freiburgense]